MRMVFTLLTLLLPLLQSQSTVDSLPRQSSTQSEALLTRGSSYISLSSPLPLLPAHLLGFSFRSCHSGRLVSQGDSQTSLRLSLISGRLEVVVNGGGQTRTEQVGESLSDGAWHTLRLAVAPGSGDRICLSVDTDMECEEPSSGPRVMNSEEDSGNVKKMDNMRTILTSLSQASVSATVKVGSSLVGCIREGPGLRFTTGAILETEAVTWGSCLLPETCQGESAYQAPLQSPLFVIRANKTTPSHPARPEWARLNKTRQTVKYSI